MSKDKLKELFQSQLYNHEIPVQPADWEIISARLNEKRRRRTVPLFYFYSTSGIVAALLLVLVLFSPESQNTAADITAKINTQNIGNNTNNAIDTVDKNTVVAGNTSMMKNKNGENTDKAVKNNINTLVCAEQNPDIYVKQNETVAAVNDSEQILTDIEKQRFEESIENPVTVTENKNTASVENKNGIQQNTVFEWWNIPDNESDKKNNNKSWSIAFVSEQNISSNSAISSFTNNIWANDAGTGSGYYSPILLLHTAEKNMLSSTPYANLDKIKDMKHKRPLNFGIRIKRNISDRIRIKTGLSYSYFMSELDATDVEIKQKIHYMGIPLGAEFLLWKKNRFNLYASGEFVVEKGVSYYLSCVGRTIVETTDVFIRKGSVRGLQFSANAGLGMSYDFAGNFGIYAEPNVVYYIKDNREPQSFRTEKPFNIGLGIGLKYNF